MMETQCLDVIGFRARRIPNTYITQDHPALHIGIILPGYSHTVDRPDLHYAGRVLLESGADLLQVEYAYDHTSFKDSTSAEQNDWIAMDVFAACNAVLAQKAYHKITLVGKSLGTLGMGYLLADKRYQSAHCIWLTPLLTHTWLVKRIEEVHPRSLFIMGTADFFYLPEVFQNLVAITNGQSLVIEGMNHGLEIPDNVSASLKALEQIVQAIQVFVAAGIKDD
jgi:pimeloyl-ACP methyl ester carboxylesterase